MPLNFPIMKGTANMATGADPTFRVPLFSHVIDNLWQGCSPAEFPDVFEQFDYDHRAISCSKDPKIIAAIYSDKPVDCRWLWDESLDEDGNPPPIPRFDKILNLFPWGKYEVPEGTEKIDVLAYDGSEVDYNTFQNAAIHVMDWLAEGHKVLVHCQAGLNRSSFVVALILMYSKEEGGYGMTADEAIDHIRKSRSPLCLCNDTFREFLKGLA